VSGAGVCEVALALRVLDGGSVPAAVLTGVFIATAAGVFVGLVRRRAHRWRPWMTHSAVVTGETSLVLFILRADDAVTAITFSVLFSWVAALAGLYLRPRAIVAHLVLLTVAVTGALVTVLGVATAWRSMVVMLPVFLGIAVICTRLAGLLRQQSTRDALTGLLNRWGLVDTAAQCTARGERTGTPWSLVAVDLDGFKQVNDRSGHNAGDRLLVATADRWRAVLRSDDVLARIGGDEFVLLLPADPAQAVATVDRLRQCTPPEVGVSAGVAPWFRTTGLDEAMHEADIALYEAKRGGRGRTVTATSAGTTPWTAATVLPAREERTGTAAGR
jgi:diguanylate cyclase (GGDEF)-like protein